MANKEYTVGKGKPPRETRFKPGQSGNPKGRPKGRKNIATEILEELTSPITIMENGRRITVPKRRAIIKVMIAEAEKGDIRAGKYLVEKNLELDALEDTNTTEITTDDAAILTAFRAKTLKEAGHE